MTEKQPRKDNYNYHYRMENNIIVHTLYFSKLEYLDLFFTECGFKI